MDRKGFDLVMPDRSIFTADVADAKQAIKNPNVALRACAVPLKNNDLKNS